MMNDRLRPLAIQQYIKLARQQGVISFAAGLPDLSVLPLEQLKAAYGQLATEADAAFQYRPPIEGLKQKIQSMMTQLSVSCSLDEILITGGAQQGIALTANLWFEQRASLMIEEFVYPGFLHVSNYYDMNYITIPSIFNQGIDLNALEQVIKTQKIIPYLYVVCNGNNPQSYTWDPEKRQSLAKLADKYNFIVVEDDPYGYLNYSDESFLPIRAYTKNAIYISSFSKIIAPAVRVGWMVGEPDIIEKFEHLKDGDDLYLSNPNQLAVNHLLEQNSLEEIVKPQLVLYRNKMDCMITALAKFLKIPYNIVLPKHGMFLWLEFPDVSIENNKEFLFETSKVLFIPGSAFSIANTIQKQALRLNFTYPSHEKIIEGIQRLANVLNRLTYT
jgi:2-aminoadipate transaminase